MEYRKYKLGDLIEQYDEINANEEFSDIDDLQGINSNKYFQECKSNKNDIDLFRYRICRKGMFSYNRATSRNGEKISIALRTGSDCIVSPSYYCFSVIKQDILCPEYLDIWFKRPVFDRYARFNSWGSATEFFSFEDFCLTEIMLPSIEEQRKIIHDYQVISDRIALLRDMNENLEGISQGLYMDLFSEYYKENVDLPEGWEWKKIGDVCDVKGGKRLPADHEFAEAKTEHPYIRIRDMYQGRFVELTQDFEYIDDNTFSAIRRYIVDYLDVIIAIVGVTAGEVSIVGKTLHKANLTENCVKLTNQNGVSANYLYNFWQHMRKTGVVDTIIVGAVQPKLPIYNIEKLPVLIPDQNTMKSFDDKVSVISTAIQNNIHEIAVLERLQKLMMSRM